VQTLLQGAGIFIWPLAICSLLAVFLIVERALALRVYRVAPEAVLKSVLNGNLDQVGPADGESVAGRLVQRWKDGASGEVLKRGRATSSFVCSVDCISSTASSPPLRSSACSVRSPASRRSSPNKPA